MKIYLIHDTKLISLITVVNELAIGIIRSELSQLGGDINSQVNKVVVNR